MSILRLATMLSTALLLFGATDSSALADEFRRLGNVLEMDWNDPANWQNISQEVTDVDGIPDDDDTVIFEQITLTSDGAANNAIIAPFVNLTITPGVLSIGNLTQPGVIKNQGRITFRFSSTSLDEVFNIVGDVQLKGGGELRLVERSNSIVTGLPLQSTLTNLDNTIVGTGSLDVAIRNHHLIRAEGGTLFLFRGMEGMDGSRIEVASDGELAFEGGQFTGGQLFGEAGSEIRGSALSLFSGEFSGCANFSGSGLRDATNVGEIRVDTPGSGERFLFLQGNIENVSRISLNNLGNNSGDATLRLIGDVKLTGGGQITMEDNNDHRIFNPVEDAFLTNVDNTISGSGFIDASIENRSLIVVSGGQLTLNKDLDNQDGIIEVESTGRFGSNGIRNVLGGTIIGHPGSLIATALFEDCTFEGVSNTDTMRIAGVLDNRGLLGSFEGPGNSALGVSGLTTLTGGGEIVLADDFSSPIFDTFGDGTAVLIIDDQIVRGASEVRIPVVNNSRIIAETDEFRFEADCDNSRGQIEVTANGFLQSLNATISGGVILGEQGARAYFDDITNATLEGFLVLTRESSSSTASVLTGEIENNAVLTLGTSNSNDVLRIEETLNLAGNGQIVFANDADRIFGNTDAILVNHSNTIRGNGSVDVVLQNFGEVIAENGDIDFGSAVTLHEPSVLTVELNGSDFAESSALNFAEPIILNGSIRLHTSQHLDVNVGDSVEVIGSPDFLDSKFSSITQTFDAPLPSVPRFELTYNLSSVEATVVEIVLIGDVNGDGVIDLLDVKPFINLIISGRYELTGDINGDGHVNLLDVIPLIDLLTG